MSALSVAGLCPGPDFPLVDASCSIHASHACPLVPTYVSLFQDATHTDATGFPVISRWFAPTYHVTNTKHCSGHSTIESSFCLSVVGMD